MPKYHTAIGIPHSCRLLTGRFDLEPSGHAREKATEEYKFQPFELPSCVTLTKEMYRRNPYLAVEETPTTPHVFEAHASDGEVWKAVARYPYDETYDQMAVIAADGTLVTAWLNLADDAHDTLDPSEYDEPKLRL